MKLETKKERLSYAVGVQIGGNLTQSGFEDMDIDILMQGIQDVLSKKDLSMNQEEIMASINESYEAFKSKVGDQNAEVGTKFLEENKSKEGVVSLPSGLQYKILAEGEGGPKPTAESTVTTHYEGMTIDGKVFDSSFERGEPTSFPVGGVIAGWTEALQLMSVGDTYELYIPSNLAYGEQGAGNDIPPNATLIFKVELIAIN
jgi:FKBP-type peptidyl-prolyl cis-trans isomerase FklB